MRIFGIHPEFIPKWQIGDEFWVFERECNLSNLDLHNFGEFERIVDVQIVERNHAICATNKIVAAWWRVVIQKKGKHDLFDASGVTPPNNLLVENVERKVPYHLKTPVLWTKPSISLSYMRKYHRPYHLFSPNNSWFSCVFFFKKHHKDTKFLRWYPISCRILPLKKLHLSLLFRPAKPRCFKPPSPCLGRHPKPMPAHELQSLRPVGVQLPLTAEFWQI